MTVDYDKQNIKNSVLFDFVDVPPSKSDDDSPSAPKQKAVTEAVTTKSPAPAKDALPVKAAAATATATAPIDISAATKESSPKKSSANDADESKDGDSSVNRLTRRNRV